MIDTIPDPLRDENETPLLDELGRDLVVSIAGPRPLSDASAPLPPLSGRGRSYPLAGASRSYPLGRVS